MAKDQLIIQRDLKIFQQRDETARELKAKDTKIYKLQEEINALKASFYGSGAANPNPDVNTRKYSSLASDRIWPPPLPTTKPVAIIA